MKDWAGIGIGIFLGGLALIGSAFEPIDFRMVPFSDTWFEDVSADEAEKFSRDLASIALSPGMSDVQKAKLLAAARRVSPLNKDVFLAEYRLSIGQEPEGLSGVPGNQINATLDPYIKRISGKPASSNFLQYISEAISPTNSAGSGSSGRNRKSVYYLRTGGFSRLTARYHRVSGADFEFLPGTLESRTFLSAYRESLKFLTLNHAAKLSGSRIEFLANPQGYGSKSAALPCAVLTKALLEGIELAPDVAYIGDVNADGTVQPVGNVREKLQGQSGTYPGVILIPTGDSASLNDIMILAGPKVFTQTQVISVRNLGQAMARGQKNRAPDLEEALTLFSRLQKVLTGPDGGKLIRNSHVKQRIGQVLDLEPNHLSARYLKMVSENRSPGYLSPGCTMDFVSAAIEPVLKSKETQSKTNLQHLQNLKRYRSWTNPVLLELVDALIAYDGGSARLGTNKDRLKQKVKDEWEAVLRDVRIREELNK